MSSSILYLCSNNCSQGCVCMPPMITSGGANRRASTYRFPRVLQLEQRAAVPSHCGGNAAQRGVRSDGGFGGRVSFPYAFPEAALKRGKTVNQERALCLDCRVLAYLVVARGLPHRIPQEPELAHKRVVPRPLRQSGDHVVRQAEREVRGRRDRRPPDVVEDTVQHSRLGLGVRHDGALQLVLHASLHAAHRAPQNETTPCKRMGSTREQTVPAL